MCRPWLASLALLSLLTVGCGRSGEFVEGTEVMAYTDKYDGILMISGRDMESIPVGDRVQYLGAAPPGAATPLVKQARVKWHGMVGTVSLYQLKAIP